MSGEKRVVLAYGFFRISLYSFDNIETLIENAGGEDSDELQESIDDFKLEIKAEGCEQIPEGEDCFTMDDIIDYLNKQ